MLVFRWSSNSFVVVIDIALTIFAYVHTYCAAVCAHSGGVPIEMFTIISLSVVVVFLFLLPDLDPP